MRGVFRRIVQHRFRRPTLVIAACLAVCAGAGLAYTYQLGDARWLWGVAVGVVCTARKQSWATLACALVLCFGMGWWRGTATLRALSPYREYARQTVTFTGRATDDAVYNDRSELVFGMDQIRFKEPRAVNVPGKITTSGFGIPAIYRG